MHHQNFIKPCLVAIILGTLSFFSIIRGDTPFVVVSISAQFNILNLLGHHGGRMEQAELVDFLLVGKSSISIVLNRMVRDDLIKREEHPKDRRQVVLVLTPRGRALWRKISPRYEASVEKVFGSLPLTRRKQFIDDLKGLYDAFLAEEGNSESDNRWHSHFSTRKEAP